MTPVIVVAGEALVDLVIGLDGTVSAALGGAPFNTARTCGRLGATVGFMGAVSDDRFGTLIAAQLADDQCVDGAPAAGERSDDARRGRARCAGRSHLPLLHGGDIGSGTAAGERFRPRRRRCSWAGSDSFWSRWPTR